MKAANMTSPRLRKVAKLLSDGRPHSTWEIMQRTKVMAISAVVSELRQNGAKIICTQSKDDHSKMRWYYTMTKSPTLATAKTPEARHG